MATVVGWPKSGLCERKCLSICTDSPLKKLRALGSEYNYVWGRNHDDLGTSATSIFVIADTGKRYRKQGSTLHPSWPPAGRTQKPETEQDSPYYILQYTRAVDKPPTPLLLASPCGGSPPEPGHGFELGRPYRSNRSGSDYRYDRVKDLFSSLGSSPGLLSIALSFEVGLQY